MTRKAQTVVAGPPRPSPPGWPGTVPDLARCERAVRSAVEGTPPPEQELAGVAAVVARALSPIERSSFEGALPESAAAPVRRAVAMRVRAGHAIATAPPPGSIPDPHAVAGLLGEIDDLLSEVNALASDGRADLVPALRGCRNSLVKAAIDFSETSQRFSRVELDLPQAPERAPRRPRSPPADRAAPGWRRSLIVAAAVAVAAGAVALALLRRMLP